MKRKPEPSGARDRLVTIEQMAESAPGFPVETWTTLVANVWMSRRDTTGAETIRAGTLSGSIRTIWEGPYIAEMDPERVDVAKTRRIVAHGRSYDIEFASVVGRGDAIEYVTLASSEVRA